MIPRLILLSLLFHGAVIASALAFGDLVPGRQIIYAGRTRGSTDIFVLDVNTRLNHNLTNYPGDDSRPAWSPSGQQIVFESWRDGSRGIYVMDADGSDLRRVSADPEASEYNPQWTPDGRAIVFQSYLRGSSDAHVYRIRPDGTGLQSVPAESAYSSATTILRSIEPQFVDGAWGTYVIEDGEKWQLTDEPLYWREPPQWSADSRYIAYVSAGSDNDVFILAADGALVEQITTDGRPKSHLSWRP